MFHLFFPETPGDSTAVSEWLFHPEAAVRLDFSLQAAFDEHYLKEIEG